MCHDNDITIAPGFSISLSPRVIFAYIPACGACGPSCRSVRHIVSVGVGDPALTADDSDTRRIIHMPSTSCQGHTPSLVTPGIPPPPQIIVVGGEEGLGQGQGYGIDSVTLISLGWGKCAVCGSCMYNDLHMQSHCQHYPSHDQAMNRLFSLCQLNLAFSARPWISTVKGFRIHYTNNGCMS